LILDSLKVDYKAIDITEPGNEQERDHFKEVCKKRDPEPIAYPPQFFNEDNYCGDWDDFFTASDEDTVLTFLGLEDSKPSETIETKPGETVETNGIDGQQDNSSHREESEAVVPPDEGIAVDVIPPDEGIAVDVASTPEPIVEEEEEEIEVQASNIEEDPEADDLTVQNDQTTHSDVEEVVLKDEQEQHETDEKDEVEE